MTKVQITKELATLIEQFKNAERDLYFFLDQVYTTYGDYNNFSSYDSYVIASAWVNGYEVIETVEDKIFGRIKKLQEKVDNSFVLSSVQGPILTKEAVLLEAEIKGLEFAYDLLMENR